MRADEETDADGTLGIANTLGRAAAAGRDADRPRRHAHGHCGELHIGHRLAGRWRRHRRHMPPGSGDRGNSMVAYAAEATGDAPNDPQAKWMAVIAGLSF